ncbi:hypothetical protein CTEN210_09704 [Chaetoceros tenuissimus]|uniref:Uncharacterized protein n=1 Tax=Chaetoceros tenuissimus TaxID=426638 RepID=A0AAD3CW27_9STRA|nr:hypothetical protein CTEN210_09704 [Chaetoceros tenuissimus]
MRARFGEYLFGAISIVGIVVNAFSTHNLRQGSTITFLQSSNEIALISSRFGDGGIYSYASTTDFSFALEAKKGSKQRSMKQSQTAEEQQSQPATNNESQSDKSNHPKEPQDTIRVRIWKALSNAQSKEMSLQQLGAIVGERKIGDLKSHLVHVEKQAKTFGNKSKDWKKRRGLLEFFENTGNKGKQVKLCYRKGKGLTYIWIE